MTDNVCDRTNGKDSEDADRLALLRTTGREARQGGYGPGSAAMPAERSRNISVRRFATAPPTSSARNN